MQGFLGRQSASLGLLLWSSVAGCAGLTPADPAQPRGMVEAEDEVRHVGLENVERIEQGREDWCWAACAEMAFRAKGIQGITQEHLVRKYKASATDQRAIELEIIQALAEHEPRERPDRGLPRQVSGDLGPLVKAAVRSASIYTSQDDAVEDMRQGEPVLLGLKNWEGMLGHVVILTKIEYQEKGRTRTGLGPLDGLMDRVEQVREDLGGDTRYRVRAVEFLDPRRGQTEPRTMTDGELRRHANFWLSTRKAGQIAADARRSLQMR